MEVIKQSTKRHLKVSNYPIRFMKKIVIVSVFFLAVSFAQPPFQVEPVVRVRILNASDTLRLLFNNEWILSSEGTSKKFQPEDGEIIFTTENNVVKIVSEKSESFVLKSINNTGSLSIKNVPFGVGWWWEGKEDRVYEGELHFYAVDKNKFEVVIHLPLEQYLKGVVPYEIGGTSPPEALKAQAVAARSEAIIALTSKLYCGEHYDLTSDVECQVFSGNDKRTNQSDLSVEETKSLILSESGKPINAYYASNCGGHSELIKNVWGDRPAPQSYSISQFDWEVQSNMDLRLEKNVREWIFSSPQSYCNPNLNQDMPEWGQNNFRWKRELTFDEATKMTSAGKNLGNLVDIEILERGTSGRAYIAKFIFEKESIEINGELKIRQMFSQPLRSSCFIVNKSDSCFILYGAGRGHGVGMCQSGAIAMANNGKTFEEILKHYYAKADLIRIY